MPINLFRALLFGAGISLFGMVTAMMPFGVGLEERFGLDGLFRIRGELPPPDNVLVVALDKTSTDILGLPKQLDRWSRIHHARLIDALKRLGAEVIAFDILFAERRDDAGDFALARAMAQADNVALIQMMSRERQAVTNPSGGSVGGMAIEQIVYPHDIFTNAALATSPFVLPKVPAQVRRYWTFQPSDESLQALPVTALQIYGLRAYGAWRRLWERVDAEYAARLPRHAHDTANRRHILSMGEELRRRLKDDPELVDRLLETLQRSEETAEAKRIVTALIRAYAEDASRILNLYGEPRTVPTIPYHRIFEESPSTLNLTGKAVFVGFSEQHIQAQRDGFVTVFSKGNGQDLAGVEIAATAFANLLADEGIKALPPLTYWGLILGWGLVAGALCLVLGTTWALTIGLALAAAYFAGTYYSFAAHNLWMPFVVPLFFQLPAAFFLGLAWRYRESSRQRARLKQAFSFYVPAEVVGRYSDESGAIETAGQLVFGTCMFSDAAQYTRLAERLDPAALGQLVNDYYATVFAPVRQNGGIISDVVGDAMLALWTAAQADRDLATRACAAALAVARDIKREAELGRPHGLPTRIGLHAGPILLGNVGAGDHYEYRAVGDTVNTATRIEGLNKLLGTRVLATETVVKDIQGMLFRPVGRFILAGKTQALGVYELLCPECDAQVIGDAYLQRYREGMAAVDEGNWDRAWKIFSVLLQQQPQDGPSRYYHMLSDAYRRQPPRGWDGVVRLENK